MAVPARAGRAAVLIALCLAIVLELTLVVTRHDGSPNSAVDSPAGHALTVFGPPASGVIGFNRVQEGNTYRFAFPIPHNTSSHPLVLSGVNLEHVPTGVQLLSYPIYSLGEVGAYPLSADDSDPADPMALQTKRDYSANGIAIAPGSDSAYFPMVTVKVVGPVSQALSGCNYVYREGGRLYHQTFRCEYRLGDESP
jgi:hypothetical protein